MTSVLLASCASAPASSGAGSQPASKPSSHADHHPHGDHHGGHDKHHEHSFDDPEHWAKRFDAPERDAWQMPAHVVELMSLEEGMLVADIGAGTGYFLPHLSRGVGAQGKVWGLDIEPKLVAYMKARAQKAKLANVQAKQIAKDDPGLAQAPVDRILIVNTWHHIPGRSAYTKKLLQGLKPGGSLYIVDFTKDAPEGPPKEFRLPPKAVQARLQEAGFEAEVLSTKLPRQYIVRGTKPRS